MNSFRNVFWQVMAVSACLLLMAVPSPAVTATQVQKTITAGTASGTLGGADVSVPITIDDPTGVGGIAFTVKYDPSIFEFKGLERAAPGWNVNTGSTYQVPQNLVQTVNGNPVTYYNPYSHTAPYDNVTTYPYTTTNNATLFYQYNDWKESNQPVGQVLVSGASAVPLTGTAIFNAKFTIKNGINGNTYQITLAPSVINNPSAGYNAPAFLPVLVGMPQPDAATGKYTSLDFPILPVKLVSGGITVSGIPAYNLGGKVTYGSAIGPNAVGCPVTLSMVTTAGSKFSDQTTIGIDGKYSFTGKPAGSYNLTIRSLDPGYDDYASPTPVIVTTASITNADAVLSQKPQPVRITGVVATGYIAGLLAKVVDGSGNVMGVFNIASNGTWSSALLPAGGNYSWYLLYGNLSTGPYASNASVNFDRTPLKTISGTIAGLPSSGGAVTAFSAKGKLLKTVSVTGTSYTINYLVPADDYVVSALAAGYPVLYYNNTTDVSTATPVSILTAAATAINFNFTAPTASITGWIKNQDSGVSGIKVYGFNVNTFALFQTTTDLNGDYNLAVTQGTAATPGAYEVFVIKGGRIFYFYNENGTPTNREFDAQLRMIQSAGQTADNTNINIAESDKTLTGKVTYRTTAGDPVANVLIIASTNMQRVLALTGQDGKYTISGLVNGATYTVEMKPLTGNYAVQTATIIAGTDTTKDFIIDTGAVLSGRVTDSVSLLPVAGAMLYLKEQATGALVGGRVYFSGTDGKYSIRDLPSGSYTLEVTHPDYLSASVDLIVGAADVTQDVALQKGAYFKGTVRDNTGKPLSWVTIIVTGGPATLYAVTNSAGFFSIYGLDAAGNYIIIAQKRGYEQQSKINQHPAAGGTTVNFTLVRPAAVYKISGTVKTDVATGNPAVNGAIVLLSSKKLNFFASTTAAPDGTYTLNDVAVSDDYQLIVIPGGNLPLQQPVNFAVTNADLIKDFVIPLGKEIAGTVTGPPAGTRIYVFLYKGTTYLSYTTIASGAFSFKGLVTGNDYNLLVVASGYTNAAPQAITAPNTGLSITLTAVP